MAKYKGLEIDRRVGIALSVLSPSQRHAVGRLIRSPQDFERATLCGRVRQLHTSGQPLYMLRVSPTLRLVYTLVGETVYIVDLVERATLDRFAARKVPKDPAGGGKKGPMGVLRKRPDALKK